MVVTLYTVQGAVLRLSGPSAHFLLPFATHTHRLANVVTRQSVGVVHKASIPLLVRVISKG